MSKTKNIPGYGNMVAAKISNGIEVDGDFFSKQQVRTLTTRFSQDLKKAAKTPEQEDDLQVAKRHASSAHLNGLFDPTFTRPDTLEPVGYLGRLLQLDVSGNKLGRGDVVTIEDMERIKSIRWNTSTLYHYEGSSPENGAVLTGSVTTVDGKKLQVAALLANENGELRFSGPLG